MAAISQVGKHDIYTVEGGFRAWQVSGKRGGGGLYIPAQTERWTGGCIHE